MRDEPDLLKVQPLIPGTEREKGNRAIVQPSASFCVVPWLHRYVDEQGLVSVCCLANGAGNHLLDNDGQPLHIKDHPDEQSLSAHPRLQELRKKMLAGEWDTICHGCKRNEEARGSSMRTDRNGFLAHHIERLLKDTDSDGNHCRPTLAHLDLRLGNHCNLSCRMCGPESSKLWTHSYNRVQPAGYRSSPERLQQLLKQSWVKDPAVWDIFRKQLEHLEWLHFAGGEPMIIPEMLQALRLCIESGRAPQILLSYNTNLTVLPRELGELWPHFKGVSVICSIDGFGKLNDYIRRPSRWDEVDRNLHFLDDHFKEWNLQDIALNTTVQLYNALDLDLLYRYLRTELRHVEPAPGLSVLTWPNYLSVKRLPAELKQQAREKLELEKSRPEYSKVWAIRSIDSVLAALQEEGSLEAQRMGNREDLLFFHRASEKEFGDSFSLVAPGLYAELRKHRLI